jgi:transcriptional regulator with XRE-family HTH domain
MAHKRKKITDQFREHFKACGKSQAQIARDTGLDVATICRFVSGERFLSPTALDTLAEYFGWEVSIRKGQK